METQPMKVLTKKDILRVTELKRQMVDVPEWGGAVCVQEMTGEARAEYDKWLVEKGNVGGMRVRVLIATVVDPETGKPLFSEIDIPDLLSKSSLAIERISDIGGDLSGLSKKKEDEQIKNLETALNVGSLSDFVKS